MRENKSRRMTQQAGIKWLTVVSRHDYHSVTRGAPDYFPGRDRIERCSTLLCFREDANETRILVYKYKE